jgi:hypothetical protein
MQRHAAEQPPVPVRERDEVDAFGILGCHPILVEAVLVRDRGIDEASLEVLGEAEPAQRRKLAVVQRPRLDSDDADAAAVADPVQRIRPRRNDELGKRRSAGRLDQSGGVAVGRGNGGAIADQALTRSFGMARDWHSARSCDLVSERLLAAMYRQSAHTLPLIHPTEPTFELRVVDPRRARCRSAAPSNPQLT